MKIIVTGASGFIGNRVLAMLKEQGCNVLGVGRSKSSSAGYMQVADYKNIPAGDVLIHLAEPNIAQVSDNHESYIDNIRDLARTFCRCPFKKYVYASSVVVYRDNLQGRRSIKEKVEPQTLYGRGKIACEQIFLEQGKSTVARIANIYGIGMSHHNVMSSVFRQLTNQNKIIKLMNLTPIRDFIWIDDVAKGICCMALNNHPGIYNLGTGIGTGIRALCETILRLSGNTDFKIIAQDTEESNSTIVPDITETLNDFSWKPEIGLETGVYSLLKELN